MIQLNLIHNYKILVLTRLIVSILLKSTVTFCATSKLNVLIIVVDDLRHLSDKNIDLPNTRKLAENGISFENAYAQQALCAPSRNSMLTSRRPDALHLYDFYSYWRDAAGNFTTLPQFFKDQGYDTYSVGKVFHPGKSSNFTDDYPYSWSYLPYHPPTEKYKDSSVCYDHVTKRLQRNLVCPVKVREQPGKSLPDLQSLNRALYIIRKRNRTRPFLLAVGFHKPHIPLKFPKHYLGRVPMKNVSPPEHPFWSNNTPLVSWHPWTDVRRRDDIKRLNISFPLGTMPYKWTMKIKKSYYAAATYIDDLIGILMRSYDKSNTILVVTSDHGWSLGENGLWAKYSNFEVALKVPFIFNVPGLPTKSVDTPVELIDLFPTLVDLVGFSGKIPKCKSIDKSPLCFDGKSLRHLMKGNSEGEFQEEFALSQYPRPSEQPEENSDKPRLKDIKIMGYSIRTRRYRYTEWISFNNTIFKRNWNNVFGIELYDHKIDSEESRNLYSNRNYKYVKNYLSKLLRSKVET